MIALSPRHQAKAKKNAAKHRTSSKQNWREWETLEIALAHATELQASTWTSFESFRWAIASHKTYEHMNVWLDALFTGEDSRYLQAIAGQDTLILSPRESAKAQPLTEMVLTPTGWRCMGELKKGDWVISCNGKPTRITCVHPQGVKPCYRITFTDGATTECSDDHLWTVRNLAGSNPNEFKTVTLNQIRTKVFVSSRNIQRKPTSIQETIYREALEEEKPWLDYRGYPKFFIPIASPVQFKKSSLPLDPYLIGVLIGDGSLKGQSSPCFSTTDIEMIDLVQQSLPSGYSVKQKGCSNNYMLSKTVRKGCSNLNVINNGLRQLKLFNCDSASKFIPKELLFSSVEDRAALLQGLMDTDGTVASKARGGGNISYCSVSKQLVDDIVALVRSLGGIATTQKPQRNWYTHKGEKKQGQISYKVGIKLPKEINPFRLTRKAQLYKPCTQYKPTRGIVDIEYIGDVEMQCITIAHKSQLYITRDYVVTHNSTFLAQFVAYEIGMHTSPWVKIALKVLGISYNIETALPRSRQIQSIIQSPLYKKIFPWVRPSAQKWGEKEWMIDLAWAGLSTTEEQYTYVCGGLNGGLNSRRAMLVFLDDLIKSPESIRSQSVRNSMESTWRTVVQFCRYDGARAICLGTQMTANDIYCTEFTPEKNWRVIRQSALLEKPDGTEYSYWEPENPKSPGTPLVRLQKEREEMPVEFSFQRQNKIIRVKEQSISPELIQRGVIPSRFDSLVLGCDLSAGKKESNDYTTLVLGGLLKGSDNTPDQYWIIDAWENRIMGNMEKLDAMIEMWEAWNHLLPQVLTYNPQKGVWEERPETGLNLFFDSSAYGLSLQGDYEDYVMGQKEILDWRVHPIPASGRGDKLYRLRKHTGLFSNKVVWFNLYGRTMQDGRKPMGRLIQQITEFGSTSHDDLADGFELCMTGLRSYLPMSKGNY